MTSYLLNETGDALLLETGGNLLLEAGTVIPIVATIPNGAVAVTGNALTSAFDSYFATVKNVVIVAPSINLTEFISSRNI